MSVLLSGASLPAPTSSASAVAPPLRTGARSAGLPAAVPQVRTGFLMPGHDAQWFERVHVLPRTYSLAFLLSEQTVAAEVWSAFRFVSRQLTAVTVTGTSGVSVDAPPTPPLWYAPLRSDVYTVRAATSGDATIDNRVVWAFAGVDSASTDLQLAGLRLLPWPFEPDMSGTLVETRGYHSVVLEAYDVTEQRYTLRARPVRALQGSFPLLDDGHVRFASALLQDWMARPFGVPLWQYQAPLLGTAPAGSSVLNVTTDDVPWTDGDAALLWADPYHWEAVRVSIAGVGALTLTSPTLGSWAAGATRVLPLAVGRLSGDQAFGWDDLAVGSVDLSFELEVV